METPALLGRYEILDKVGSGGMGTVYKARDPHLQRVVALKVVLAGSTAEMHERFLREGRIAARLVHPNIVNVFDLIQLGDGICIVQEFLEGTDLEKVLRTSDAAPVPHSAAVDILAQVADALAFAHDNGVIHRDVKPSNIRLLPSGQVKVIDFGVALSRDEDTRLTMTGAFLGTIAYSSPEQIRGLAIDQRSEVFSFGALAFELLAGRRAFAGGSLHVIVQKIVNEETPTLQSLDARIPAPLDAIVARCLAKEPGDRPQSMGEVAAVLRSGRLLIEGPTAAEWMAQRQPASPEAAGGAAPAEVDPSSMPTETRTAERMLRPTPVDATVIGTLPPMPMPATSPRGTRWRRPRPAPPPAEVEARRGADVERPVLIGRFTALEVISRGRSGTFYRAFDPVRGSLVGLRVVEEGSEVDRQRLLRASKLWLNLQHPNVVRILEVEPGGAGRGTLVVSELLDGRKLEAFVAEMPLTLEQKVFVAFQICGALAHIHDRGVLHREVTPRNILISREGLKATLLESGIARPASGEGTMLTQAGLAVGDLEYMAPEQIEGKAEQRSDLFSLAATLVFLVTRRPPKPLEVDRTIDGLRRTPGLPPRLVAILEKGLARDPDERFRTAQEMAESLQELLPPEKVEIPRSRTVVTLHGIRTHASWQRALSEVAAEAGYYTRLDRWNFGYFSVLRFLVPWSRRAKVSWLRRTYHEEFPELTRNWRDSDLPSIIAHSFGTYILGNALLRYPYLRFNKVILCGSILPRAYPWSALVARGQVQAVRNEYGARDVWTRLVGLFVPGTGPSGITGFLESGDRIEQEEFDFDHSEYFERGHMESKWLPFLRRRLTQVDVGSLKVEPPEAGQPWLLYLLYAVAVGALVLGVVGAGIFPLQ